jgi:hypothetical protein
VRDALRREIEVDVKHAHCVASVDAESPDLARRCLGSDASRKESDGSKCVHGGWSKVEKFLCLSA